VAWLSASTDLLLVALQNQSRFLGQKNIGNSAMLRGGNSGAGSYDKFAKFKAEIVNAFVVNRKIKSVIEFGCGDGNQLELARYPKYTGVDVSQTVITSCWEKFRSDPAKTFLLTCDCQSESADLALSLDVIFHLVEDGVYEDYMSALFSAALRYVVIYSSNSDDNAGYEGTHVKHRKFAEWVQRSAPNWNLIERIPNRYPYTGDYKTGSFADFYIYEKTN
jgi:SAM-dependent methyltransferase